MRKRVERIKGAEDLVDGDVYYIEPWMIGYEHESLGIIQEGDIGKLVKKVRSCLQVENAMQFKKRKEGWIC